MNVKSIYLHIVTDAVSSVGVIAAALIVVYTGMTLVDPIVSIGISAVILYWAWGVLKESGRILLEIAPKGLDADTIADSLKKEFSGISEVFDVHVWTITSDMAVFSGKIKLKDPLLPAQARSALVKSVKAFLHDKHGLEESTIEISSDEASEKCSLART